MQHLDFLDDQEKAIFKTAFELDQRWVIEHAADRTPYICQSQSVNLFLPANVHKRDLHQIHMMAWKRGVKTLYYCRSLSIQRADVVSSDEVVGQLATRRWRRKCRRRGCGAAGWPHGGADQQRLRGVPGLPVSAGPRRQRPAHTASPEEPRSVPSRSGGA